MVDIAKSISIYIRLDQADWCNEKLDFIALTLSTLLCHVRNLSTRKESSGRCSKERLIED